METSFVEARNALFIIYTALLCVQQHDCLAKLLIVFKDAVLLAALRMCHQYSTLCLHLSIMSPFLASIPPAGSGGGFSLMEL